MSVKERIAVDFRQETSISQVLSPPDTLISSRDVAWNNMHFEYHYHPSHETPEHYPVQHVIAVQTEGQVQAERRLDGKLKRERISPGDVCIVPAHHSHWIHSEGEQGLIFLSLDPDFIRRVAADALNSNSVELIAQFARPDPLIYQIGLSLKRAIQNNPANSRFYAESLSVALAAHLIENYSTLGSPLSEKDGSLAITKVQTAKDYINDFLFGPLSLETIAQTVDISQYHFCRLFRQVTGMSPWQYVIQQRIDTAKRLLDNPKSSIAEVSRTLGFSTQGQFTNFFRRHSGMSPTAYRKHL